MQESTNILRNVSDTALWVAVYRAQESARKDALFNDPLAAQLAGERGRKFAGSQKVLKRLSWPFVTRTWLIDRTILKQIKKGTKTVINLAAGLDTRPYRMHLPADLNWIEIDLPDLFDYKEGILKNEKPVCQLERIRLDLADEENRKGVFRELSQKYDEILILTEGLLVYLSEVEVSKLSKELSRHLSIKKWIIDLASPPLLKMMNQSIGDSLERANAQLKFAPAGGVHFFEPLGWKSLEVYSMFKTARKINRLSLFLRLMSYMPENEQSRLKRPWSGVCLFENTLAENSNSRASPN